MLLLGIFVPFNKLFLHTVNGYFLSIALDRYIAIVHPFFYQSRLPENTTKFFIIGSWMYGVFIAIIHAQYMRFMDWSTCTTPYSVLLTNVTDMSSYLLIAVTMVVIYGRILVIAMQQQSKIEAIMTTTGVIQTGNDASHPSETRGEMKAARMTAMILGCYILLWIPYYFGRISQACGNTKPYVDYLIQIG